MQRNRNTTYASDLDLVVDLVRLALSVGELLREALDLSLAALVLLDDARVRLEAELELLPLRFEFVGQIRNVAGSRCAILSGQQ